MEKQETFVSGFGGSSVEPRQLEVRRSSDYFVDQSKTGATVLEKGKEAGTSSLLFVFSCVVRVCSHLILYQFHFVLSMFNRDFDRLPDSGRDLQIACDKRIVGAE